MNKISFSRYLDNKGPRHRDIIPHLIKLGFTTIVWYPPELSVAWLVQYLWVKIGLGGECEPFGAVEPRRTHLITAQQDTDENQRASEALVSCLTGTGIGARFRDNLVITHVADGRALPTNELITIAALSNEVDDCADVIVIEDVAPLLAANERSCEKLEHLDRVFRFCNEQNKSGNAVLVFVAATRAGPADLRPHLARSLQLNLARDPGGAQNAGASLLVHRAKTSFIDKAPTFFRYYYVFDLDGVHIGWDLPLAAEAEEERKEDRDKKIRDLHDRGMKKVDIAKRFQMHPSNVGRIIGKSPLRDEVPDAFGE